MIWALLVLVPQAAVMLIAFVLGFEHGSEGAKSIIGWRPWWYVLFISTPFTLGAIVLAVQNL